MKRAIRHALCPVLGSLVLACGGGGGSDVAGGGIGGTGVSSGPISGFGSIFVAGTEWQTGSAESITIDGVEVSETDLKLGMQTRVKGSKSADGESGTATSVAVDNSAEGPVSAPVASPGLPAAVESVDFVVLGREFVADGRTAFSDGYSLEALAAGEGQWVESSLSFDGLTLVDAVTIEKYIKQGVGTTLNVRETDVIFFGREELGTNGVKYDFAVRVPDHMDAADIEGTVTDVPFGTAGF